MRLTLAGYSSQTQSRGLLEVWGRSGSAPPVKEADMVRVTFWRVGTFEYKVLVLEPGGYFRLDNTSPWRIVNVSSE